MHVVNRDNRHANRNTGCPAAFCANGYRYADRCPDGHAHGNGNTGNVDTAASVCCCKMCMVADRSEAMIDQLCIDQIDVCRLLRNAARRGDRALVAHYMACWRMIDRMIKEQS